MRSSLIAALLAGLLVFPASLPAGDAPALRAENLGDTPLFTQPLLLAVANLDQRIGTTTDTADRARLTHQRARVLEQLNRAILSRGGSGFAAPLPADELQRLRDTVSTARRSGDKTAEMTAILRLNSAILDQSFTDLLKTVARDWIRFAPAADFNGAFNRSAHRTAFDQVPFGRAVQRLEAVNATTLSDAEQALIGAYQDYSQRAAVYDAVALSLSDFVKGAATSNRLLHWLGISTLIGTIDAQATRVLFLRESDERMLSVIDSLYVVLIVWALLRLIDNFVMLYSSELLRRYPTLRGELVNFLSSVTRFLVIVIALLYLLQHFGFDIRALLASLGIGGLAVAFAAKETIANIFGCISIIVDDMFRQRSPTPWMATVSSGPCWCISMTSATARSTS
jgi:hypothetical protein